MLAHRDLCDLIHHIGIASLAADEKQIWHLTKLYWYTVEFGVVKEGGDVKVCVAGGSLLLLMMMLMLSFVIVVIVYCFAVVAIVHVSVCVQHSPPTTPSHHHTTTQAFGAGVLSSYGELQHMASGAAALEPFDPFDKQPKMSYKDGYQTRYFVLDSFEDGAAKLRAYCNSLQLPAEVLENPHIW